LAVLWVIWTVVTVGLLGHAVVSAARDRRILRSVTTLAVEGRNAEALDHPLPSRRNRPLVRVLQAGCAVRTGRYAVALALLRPYGSCVRGAGPDGPDLVRGSALVALGRYAEAATLLGDRPAAASLRRLRAAVATEVGDDARAEDLLAAPDDLADDADDGLAEAGRLRLLADLRLRRGRLTEARDLAHRARSLYARLRVPGVDVDEAWCSVLLSKVALAEDHAQEARALVEQGLAALQRRPDNAPGLAEAHAVAAEAAAAVGRPADAQDHLRQAHAHAVRCASPALDAELARATAQVSLRLGHPAEARRWLLDAARRHDDLGARPAAETLRRQLASLEA
jgi:tetratricopeptide (TPR) repeat protein